MPYAGTVREQNFRQVEDWESPPEHRGVQRMLLDDVSVLAEAARRSMVALRVGKTAAGTGAKDLRGVVPSYLLRCVPVDPE